MKDWNGGKRADLYFSPPTILKKQFASISRTDLLGEVARNMHIEYFHLIFT